MRALDTEVGSTSLREESWVRRFNFCIGLWILFLARVCMLWVEVVALSLCVIVTCEEGIMGTGWGMGSCGWVTGGDELVVVGCGLG